MSRQSEALNELAAALNQVQKSVLAAKADSMNPFFHSRYADLAAVWAAVREPLTKAGLSIVQLPQAGDPDVVTLETVLMHNSGQWIASTITMRPVKQDPQGVGSCLTYARRYGLAAMVGITVTEDDDANAASTPKAAKPAIPQVRAKDDKKVVKAADRYTGEPVKAPAPVPDFDLPDESWAQAVETIDGHETWSAMKAEVKALEGIPDLRKLPKAQRAVFLAKLIAYGATHGEQIVL